jgi:hypothetical protein
VQLPPGGLALAAAGPGAVDSFEETYEILRGDYFR